MQEQERPPRFENDDYSPYAGPGYHPRHHPGLSGKDEFGESWINQDEYEAQRRFVGRGPRGYHRSDDRLYEEVCEALKRDPEIEAQDIGVKVDHGVVTLEGHVRDRLERRTAEIDALEVPGVVDVFNDLRIS